MRWSRMEVSGWGLGSTSVAALLRGCVAAGWLHSRHSRLPAISGCNPQLLLPVGRCVALTVTVIRHTYPIGR